MENSIKKQISEAVSNNVVDYFANSITGSDFVEKHIKSIIPATEEQEEKICNILAEYNRDFENADCDPEGATQEQDKNLDSIIEKCSNEIITIFE